MSFGKEDVDRMVELIQDYKDNLTYPSDTNLQECMKRVISMCQSELFNALLDIHEYHKDVLLNSAAPALLNNTPHINNNSSVASERPHPGLNLSAAPPEQPTFRPEVSTLPKAPPADDTVTETILLEKGRNGLGFSISGGYDTPHYPNDNKIYITKIIPNSVSDMDGRLKVNDCLLKVMDKDLENVSHDEAVDILKNSPPRVLLTIERKQQTEKLVPRVIEVSLNKGEKGLGISIAGGKGNQHIPDSDGIYITKIISGGAADKDGTLQVGDRILLVNNVNIEEVTHDDAVEALKGAGDNVILVIAQNMPEVYPESAVVSPQLTHPSREARRVTLEKGPEGLGFNIVGGEYSEGIYVSFVLPGGVADVSGSLKMGDQILQVNDEDMTDATHETAANKLKASGSQVDLMVKYNPEGFARFEKQLGTIQNDSASSPASIGSGTLKTNMKKSLYVRALFDYDKSKDPDLPGPGLSFRHGDILHVINASDDEWWQARRVTADGTEEGRGVIPSKKRVEKKERSRNRSVKFSSSSEEAMMMGSTSESSTDAVYTYEPVVQTWIKYMRPVIILGPLKDRVNDDLMAEFPDKFGSCVPHTTREKREHEVHGRDYFFVSSRAEMERDIQNHLFIEAGQFNDNLYGTSIASVRDVSDLGKMCILDVSGYAIKRLRQAQLFPIVIFLRPTSPEAIRNSRMSEEQAKKNYERAMRLEHEFKHYFTACVSIEPGRPYDNIYGEMKEIIKLHSQPACWITSKDKI
ncbi:disks large homolog 2-like isoform X2 [Bolinopsis microptera]|uniref:disks large homolog 2-like isoform X2 n=1 Tax=Bolinopsis microptera TaxID=2820187 RepID=UPI00307AEE4E